MEVWVKTDTCNLLKNMFGMKLEQNCEPCVDKFQTLSNNKKNILKVWKKTGILEIKIWRIKAKEDKCR